MFTSKNLYLVLTEEYSSKPILDVAKEAVDAGIDILQMREKFKSKDEFVRLGTKLRDLCIDIPFIVNDDPSLALELNADGVHLGQEDYRKHKEARKILKNKIIGLSTHSLEEVSQANDFDVDYIAFGPIFETKTKDYSVGLSEVEEVLNIAKRPVVFIGGIDAENIDSLIDLGADNIAVIKAIVESESIDAKVKCLKGKIDESIFITLNGKKQRTKISTLNELITKKNFNPEGIVIEYNKEVVRPKDWSNIFLKENDSLEIVGIFAGG